MGPRSPAAWRTGIRLWGLAARHHNSLPGDFSRLLEHRVQHRLGELAGERVLLAGVKRAEQYGAGSAPVLGEVAEARPRANAEQQARRVPRELAEAHDDGRFDQPQLLGRVREAVVALDWQRLIGRRRAAYRGADPRSAQFEPIARMNGVRLVREAGPVHRRVQPVARAV